MNSKALQRALRAGTPVLIWGPPGVGKTATVYALGRSLGLPVESVIASIRDPADFGGFPVPAQDGLRLEPMAWAKRLAEAGRGILFLDEISTAPPAVQAALLRVVLERVVGDLHLPPDVKIIAAANPPDMAAGGWDLAPPLANRFTHLYWKLDPMAWVEEFPGYWGQAPDVPGLDGELWARARAMVAAFIRARPSLLLQVPKSAEQQGKAWPSPRSWDNASRLLASVMMDGEEATEAVELIAGAVGEGPGLEFVAWARELSLPDPEELLANPDSFKLPPRGDQAYAVLSAVASAAVSKLTAERWRAAWKIMAAAADQGAIDIAASAVRTLARARDRERFATPSEARKFIPLLQQAGLMTVHVKG